MKKVYIASDHAGFKQKSYLIKHLNEKGIEIEDMGADQYNPQDDYPDLIVPIAQKISSEEKSGEKVFGIILGGSGQGEAIVANRFAHVRAGVYNTNNLELVKLMREHNDANIISFGSRFISDEEALAAAELFLETPFSFDPRHERRIKEIDIEC